MKCKYFNCNNIADNVGFAYWNEDHSKVITDLYCNKHFIQLYEMGRKK